MLSPEEEDLLRRTLVKRQQSLELVVAHSLNGVIGDGGLIPWREPADLQNFKTTTMGGCLLMGRRTWQSIQRALPGRTTLVISTSPLSLPEGVLLADSPLAALQLAPQGARLFAVGGAAIYQAFWPLIERCHITLVKDLPPGDVRFHALSLLAAGDWLLQERRALSETAELFVFQRRPPPDQ
ncbi:MAG: dihydrofolate reductase [Leptospirales bacterium]|nr:dihydrofolate reductase [Leptospirales bacterium]